MWKRLQAVIAEMEAIEYERLTEEDKNKIKEKLLTKIAFFQHERLIHLIVTVVFALLTLLTLILVLISTSIGFIVLELLFIVLLIPYIVHYYHLENGVQQLYRYYDKLI